LFLEWSSLWNFRQVFAFINLFVNIEPAIASAVLGDVWVSIVARANYVSVVFEYA
jgi:hypothetical protein